MSLQQSYLPPRGSAGAARRQQVPPQPPSLLTTSLGNASELGRTPGGYYDRTPASTTSLSSPFSSHQSSVYTPSVGGLSRGTSPMAVRSATGFSAPYNPQQWTNSSHSSPVVGPIQPRQTSRTVALGIQPRGPDEPVASPPPPYSPRRSQEMPASARTTSTSASPSDIVSPGSEYSQYATPVSTATTISPNGLSQSFNRQSPHAISRSTHGSPLTTSVAFPPPPPGTGPRPHASSKGHADRIIGTLSMRTRAYNNAPQVAAIEALQEGTTHALAQAPEHTPMDLPLRAPASRRAASTGGIGVGSSSLRPVDPSPGSHWEPGMPLPPPPPGPPPPTSRSQSVNRVPDTYSTSNSFGTTSRTRRPPPGSGSTLETVPPTPAGWVDEDVASPKSRTDRTLMLSPLQIDTRNVARYPARSDIPASTTSVTSSFSRDLRRDSRDLSGGVLTRTPAVRNRSAKGIRERRSESKNGKGRAPEAMSAVSCNTHPWSEGSDDAKPTDLNLGGGSILQRRGPKASPTSARSIRGLDEALHHATNLPSSGTRSSIGSSHTTPRPESSRINDFPKGSTPTPPFSPGESTFQDFNEKSLTSANIPPKALPTPPPQQPNETLRFASLLVPTPTDQRPISHLLHMPNEDVPTEVLALSPQDTRTIPGVLTPEAPSEFARRAIERHRVFIGREAAAVDDAERLHLFTQYMVAESRVRRDCYASVFESEGIDPNDLMHGMFDFSVNAEEHNTSQPTKSNHETTKMPRRRTPEGTSSERSRRSTPTPPAAVSRPRLDIGGQVRPESTRHSDYVPCLSPIASLSAVTGRDEMESRGRTPSRWWESHSGGSNGEEGFKVLERSKRESKYMGLPAEARNSPALYDQARARGNSFPRNHVAGSSNLPAYGVNEYPAEKIGWGDESSMPTPLPLPPTPMSAPYTPNSTRLDISRLVTLPPPFPRHHPAVNNNHPDLSDVRAVIRSVNDMTESKTVRETYESKIAEKRQRADSWCKHQRSLHAQDMQYRMEHEELSQQEYDQAEATIEAKESKSTKELTQVDFDLFQNSVVSPLHALFADRINKASTTFNQLIKVLFPDSFSHSPNLPQEEGDDHPELLEKLTQLKWLFEARELLHRETYNLLSERNDKYKAIVLLPYQQAHNMEKLADAETFFAKDSLDRKLVYQRDAVSRFEAFLAVIETNVMRGVEMQLSAFWDIAPSLLTVLQRIPLDLYGFDISIPSKEMEETPLYWEHPLRYLYEVVEHAENSSRQFIESQINLWCLLQEVREGCVGLKFTVLALEANGWEQEARVEERKKNEEERLMADLKDKVGEVERQWEESLGEEVEGVKERVKDWLMDRGGWDEEEDEA